MRILRQKSVAGVDGVHVGNFRRADDAVNAQIALVRRRFANTDRFVGQLHVHRISVGFRIDRHRADVQLFARADDAHGDLPAIGYENFLKHAVSSCARATRLPMQVRV